MGRDVQGKSIPRYPQFQFQDISGFSRRLGALGTQICPDNGGSSVQKRPLPKVTRWVRGVKLPSSMAVALGDPGKTV